MNRIIVSIQSFGDIITNSSSEIFCTITGDANVLDFIAELLSHVFDNYGDREIDPMFEYKNKEDVYKILKSENTRLKDVFLMTLDALGKYNIVQKEENV